MTSILPAPRLPAPHTPQIPLQPQFTFPTDLGVGGRLGAEEGTFRLESNKLPLEGWGWRAYGRRRLCHCLAPGLAPGLSLPICKLGRRGEGDLYSRLCQLESSAPLGTVLEAGRGGRWRERAGGGERRRRSRRVRVRREAPRPPRQAPGRGGGGASGAGLPGGLAGGPACVSAVSPGVFH